MSPDGSLWPGRPFPAICAALKGILRAEPHVASKCFEITVNKEINEELRFIAKAGSGSSARHWFPVNPGTGTGDDRRWFPINPGTGTGLDRLWFPVETGLIYQ